MFDFILLDTLEVARYHLEEVIISADILRQHLALHRHLPHNEGVFGVFHSHLAHLAFQERPFASLLLNLRLELLEQIFYVLLYLVHCCAVLVVDFELEVAKLRI